MSSEYRPDGTSFSDEDTKPHKSILQNELEKAKEEIGKIVNEAEHRISQKKASKVEFERQRILADIQRKETETLHASNLEFILKNAPNLLQQVNEELFDKKGKVTKWQEVDSIYITSHSDQDSDSGRWFHWKRSHPARQLETRLEVPELGSVNIVIPTQIGHEQEFKLPFGLLGLGNKTITRVVFQPIEEKNRECYVLSLEGGSKGLLQNSPKDVSVELTRAVIDQAILLLKRHHSSR